jgi:murein DD-endopeptidase MepM/ murein hydrolase activator NlpD
MKNIFPGSHKTCDFGFTRRYKGYGDNQEWGYPGIHKGVDFAGGKELFTPISFGKSDYQYFGDEYYGTFVKFLHRAGFMMRIAHMRPETIKILPQLKAKESIPEGTLIGPPGDFGNSTGPHLHLEFEAWGYTGKWLVSCSILDATLYKKYGNQYIYELSEEEILSVYKKCEKTDTWKSEDCLKDFQNIRKEKNIFVINKFKIVFLINKKLTTYYNPEYILEVLNE